MTLELRQISIKNVKMLKIATLLVLIRGLGLGFFDLIFVFFFLFPNLKALNVL